MSVENNIELVESFINSNGDEFKRIIIFNRLLNVLTEKELIDILNIENDLRKVDV